MDAVEICNMALAGMGGGTRNSIDSIFPSDGSSEADFFSLMYTQYVKSVFRSAHWNCLRKQDYLTVVKAGAGTSENPDGTTIGLPPRPWRYSYLYPPDCILARFIQPFLGETPSSSTPALAGTYATTNSPMFIGSVKFIPANDADSDGNPTRVILTNMEDAELVYTANIQDPNMWDVHLVQAVIASLSAIAVDGLAMNAALAKKKSEEARSIILQARVSDGNEGVTNTSYTPDWIAARGGSTFYNSDYYGSWEAMSLPGIPAF
jgi:hypothetical protein